MPERTVRSELLPVSLQLRGLQTNDGMPTRRIKPKSAAARQAERDERNRRLADALISRVKGIKKPLPQAWNDVFHDSRIGGPVLATAFLRLHDAKDYETSIEGMLAAIRNDHGQPWMYDVLALQMSLAKRPEKEINRVLLSRIDFTDGNEAQMLVTASMLSQFGEYGQAVSICREAAKRNPWQVATWTMARNIADRAKDTDAIVWSRVGTLRYVWDRTFETAHAEAETVLNDVYARLRNENKSAKANSVKKMLHDARQRDLKIEIKWAGNADLDLVVIEPGGHTCSYNSRRTRNGGILVRQGDGAGQGQSELYVCPTAPSGDYLIRVRNILGRLITGKVLVKVTRYEGTDRQKSQTAFHELGDRVLEIKVPLSNGRASADE